VDQVVAAAFLDELAKIAFADSHMAIPKSREGRRPIAVDKLLDKDRAGELYKKGGSKGPFGLNAQGHPDPSVPYDPVEHHLMMTRHEYNHPELPTYEAAGIPKPKLTPEQQRHVEKTLASWGPMPARYEHADSQGNPRDKKQDSGVLGGPWAPLIRSGAGALAGGALGAWAGKPGTGALIGGGLGLGASAVHSRLESQHDLKELRERVQRLEKSADSQGSPQDTAAGSVDDPGAAKAKKSPGDGPTQGNMIPLEAKYGSLKIAMGQGSVYSEGPGPIPTGETPGSGPETKQRKQSGDVPTQEVAVDRLKSAAFVAPGADPNSTAEGRRPRKKGDVPTRDDLNSVDRNDLRESTTTVTGLGQSSSDIGAQNHPSEHS